MARWGRASSAPGHLYRPKKEIHRPGHLFQVLEQIAQLTGHHAANENARKAASAIHYRDQHLNVGIGQPALGSGFSDPVGDVRQIGYLHPTERAVERLLKLVSSISRKTNNDLPTFPLSEEASTVPCASANMTSLK